ncbi:MAG: transposase [Thermoleophilaceae bacterium]
MYAHETVDHAECYVDGRAHTNGLESFWSLLKRGLNSAYVGIEPFHLFRYLDERLFALDSSGDANTRTRGRQRGGAGRRIAAMLRVVRIALQVVIFFLLLSVVVGVASGHTGLVEKAALVAVGALLIWAASLVWRLGRPTTALG